MTDSVKGRVSELNERYGRAEPAEIVRALIQEEFPGRIALVSSFGAESAVLLHMISRVDPAAPVVFLDTGKLFGETKRYRDTLVEQLGLSGVNSVSPNPDLLTDRDPRGVLWAQDPDACCAIRKVEPLQRALKPFDAWITGRKAFQSGARSELSIFESADGRIKINPLALWEKPDIDTYFESHGLPRHPLEVEGYFSIGCMPCTDKVAPDEHARAGRWRGADKTECGIHMPTRQVLAKLSA